MRVADCVSRRELRLMDAMDWLDRFPELARLPQEAARQMRARAHVVSLPKGTRIYGTGQTPANYLLLLSGSVKVVQTSESGRAIVLYRIGPGESCVLTTACIVGGEDYPAEALAETDVEAVALGRDAFETLLAQSDAFRAFVFAGFGRRFADLFRVVEDVAFARVDMRLVQKLLALAAGSEIAATQQDLAEELGTAREVVSRMLGELQRRGWVEVRRGHILILERDAMERFVRDN